MVKDPSGKRYSCSNKIVAYAIIRRQAALPARVRRLGRASFASMRRSSGSSTRARGGARVAADPVRGAALPRAAPDHRLRMSELARSVLLSQSGVTRLVDRLEARGLVVREPCPEDRRVLLRADHRRGPQAPRPRRVRRTRRHSRLFLRPLRRRRAAPARRRLGAGRPGRDRVDARAGSPHVPGRIGSRGEDRHRRAVLVVVLGGGRRARGAPGRRARGPGARGQARDGQRPSGPVHPCAPPARRAAREPAPERDPGRAVGDRARRTARCRTSCSARGRSSASGACSSASGSTCSTSTSR